MRYLLPALLVIALCVAPDLWAATDSAGVALSKRAYCQIYQTLTGNVGLLVGFGIALWGLWVIIQGSVGWGIFMIAGGAVVTQIPALIEATLLGTNQLLGNSGITTNEITFDYIPQRKNGDCNSIVVDLSSYQNQSSVSGMNGENTSVNGLNGDVSGGADGNSYASEDIASIEDAQQLIDERNAACSAGDASMCGPIGGCTECVCLAKAFANGELGPASGWRPGARIQDTEPEVGSIVGTFTNKDANGNLTYGTASKPGGESGYSHAGVYVGKSEDGKGFYLMEQYNSSGGPKISYIPFDNPGNNRLNGSGYYTITRK